MTDRCEPPEELRGVDGWHWVKCCDDGKQFIARWSAAPHSGLEPLWARYGESATPAWAAAHWGWRYIAPVTPPAEAEALRAEKDRVVAEARECAAILTAHARDLETISGVARRTGEEIATLRATVAGLVATLEQIGTGDHPEGTSLALNGNYRELSVRMQNIALAAISRAKEAGL